MEQKQHFDLATNATTERLRKLSDDQLRELIMASQYRTFADDSFVRTFLEEEAPGFPISLSLINMLPFLCYVLAERAGLVGVEQSK